jgi:hypothetical protein
MKQFTLTLALLLILTALSLVPTLIPRSAPHPTEPVPVASPSLTGRTWGLAASGRAEPAQGRIARPMIGGDANFADPVHGSRYLAIRFPRGTLTRVCGKGRCMILRSTDYGPKRSTGDIADIGLASFARICGYTVAEARLRGECRVSIALIEELPAPPATDTAP